MKHREELELRAADKLVGIATWATLAILWALTMLKYGNLPDAIPTHFNIAGHADYHGSKSFIFVLPVVGTLLTIGLTVPGIYPNWISYPVKAASEDAPWYNANAARMIRYVRWTILIGFVVILILTFESAADKGGTSYPWLVPLLIILNGAPVLIFAIRSLKRKRAR